VRRGARMVGFSFAIAGGPKMYLPFGHEDPEDNLPPANCVRYLIDQMRDFDGELVGANLSYDLDFILAAGVKTPNIRKFRDVLLADALLFSLHQSYSLDAVSRRRGFEGKNEELLRAAAKAYRVDPADVKTRLWELPARYAGPYAEDDAWLPLAILDRQDQEIAAVGCEQAWELECNLLPILVRMRQRGVIVDQDRLDKVEEWTKSQEGEALAEVKHHTGIGIPVGDSMNAALVATALREAGIEVPETRTGKASVRRDVLEDVDHAVARAIVRARKFSMIRTTFVAGVRDHMTRGRIHCTFNQLRKTDEAGDGGVMFGRMSSEHPNMQNQPSASRSAPGDVTGHTWRSIYRPNPGQLWASKDLKQQEPKWSFHIAALLKLKGAEELCAKFREDPTLDTYKPLGAAADIPRSAAKIVWLSLAYDKKDGTLCEDLGLPKMLVTYDRRAGAPVPIDSERGRELTPRGHVENFDEAKRTGLPFAYWGAGEEGRRIIDKFNEGAPFMRMAARIAKRVAKEKGYVSLVDKRRLHFPSTDDEYVRVAFNRIIQGNSAVQTKVIMVELSSAGFDEHLLLQVHDEVASSVPEEKTARDMAEVMRTAMPMRLPTVVDVEMGPSWGESMKVEMPDGSKRDFHWTLN
jgi:DNA polymerase I-like protein with 3'-5' exonuclease and polymerase domains